VANPAAVQMAVRASPHTTEPVTCQKHAIATASARTARDGGHQPARAHCLRPCMVWVYPPASCPTLGGVRTYVPMTEIRFTRTRYQPDQPWVIISRDHMTVELPDPLTFTAWAVDRFPNDRIDRLPTPRDD
jgi:hypothetical protein